MKVNQMRKTGKNKKKREKKFNKIAFETIVRFELSKLHIKPTYGLCLVLPVVNTFFIFSTTTKTVASTPINASNTQLNPNYNTTTRNRYNTPTNSETIPTISTATNNTTTTNTTTFMSAIISLHIITLNCPSFNTYSSNIAISIVTLLFPTISLLLYVVKVLRITTISTTNASLLLILLAFLLFLLLLLLLFFIFSKTTTFL